MGSIAELCQGVVDHAGELLAAEGSSLALVRKDCGGRNNLEEVIALKALGCLTEGSLYSQAHQELLKGVMECALATGSPMNLTNASEVNLLAVVMGALCSRPTHQTKLR